MKRLAAVALIASALSLAPISAAERAAAHESESGRHSDHTTLWKTLNFAILAGAIGYFLKKHGSAFFQSRTSAIQRDIAEAAQARRQAEARAADMERRMAGLQAELAELRRASHQEMAAEEARLKAATEQMLTRIQVNAEHEIASAVTCARKELRAYAAELALQLARGKVRQRITPEIADRLVDSFAGHVPRNPRRSG